MVSSRFDFGFENWIVGIAVLESSGRRARGKSSSEENLAPAAGTVGGQKQLCGSASAGLSVSA
jgi:hypothetical protein